ncbi:hypothetical protein H4W81_000951 [Nonomuraea africana]|uniref:Uncharacterized protein n=1 Tax=Nonomuraea africana TaxID=46171 RepID=A0ABR9K840_9ACTN|nr:hypothetical protein [Nonomuraea africana]
MDSTIERHAPASDEPPVLFVFEGEISPDP